MAILIIEDEKKLVDILKRALKTERFSVDAAYDGQEGLDKASTGNYELIILDLMMPKKDGILVCKELRKRQIHTPVIMLTARGTVEDRVTGLDCGADDYLVKPFGIDELLARVRAVMRRPKISDPLIWKLADIIIDPQKHEVTRAGKVMELTPKEYCLLETLIRHRGEALSRRHLLDQAWSPEFQENNKELNVHINYLRKKVDENRERPLIWTVRGVGYAMKE